MLRGTPPDVTHFYTGDGGRMPVVIRNKGPCVCTKCGIKRLRDCCLRADGRIVVDDPSPLPTTITEHVLPECYAASLRDCSRSLSREHYVSEGVLRLLPNSHRMTVVGPVGTRGDRPRKISAGQAYERILCERHNSKLSPIDDTGIWFFGGNKEALQRPESRTS